MRINDAMAFIGLLFLALATVAGCVLGSHWSVAVVTVAPATPATAAPTACTFDGGGWMAAGAAPVRTSDGRMWGCAAGQLYLVAGQP